MIKQVRVGKKYVFRGSVVEVTEILPATFAREQIIRWERIRPGGRDLGSSYGRHFRGEADAYVDLQSR